MGGLLQHEHGHIGWQKVEDPAGVAALSEIAKGFLRGQERPPELFRLSALEPPRFPVSPTAPPPVRRLILVQEAEEVDLPEAKRGTNEKETP